MYKTSITKKKKEKKNTFKYKEKLLKKKQNSYE